MAGERTAASWGAGCSPFCVARDKLLQQNCGQCLVKKMEELLQGLRETNGVLGLSGVERVQGVLTSSSCSTNTKWGEEDCPQPGILY